MPWGWGELRDRRGQPALGARTTSSGRATSTRSPPRCWRRATRPRPTARSTSCSTRSSSTTARSRRTRQVDGTPKWKGCRWTRSGLPIVLAWQLGRTDANDWRHVRKAADFIVENGPDVRAGALGEPGGLLAGRRSRPRSPGWSARPTSRARNGDGARAATLLERRPTRGRRNVAALDGDHATARTRRRAVLPAADQGPQARTRAPKYAIGDSGPSDVDQRRVVDPASSSSSGSASSAPTTRSIVNTLQVVDAQAARPARFWHRFSFDGYGERRDGESVAAVRRRHAPDARAGRGRSSPASAASTSCSRAGRRAPAAAGDGRRRATTAGCSPSRSGTAAHRPASTASRRARERSRATPFGLDARAARPARLVGRGGTPRWSARQVVADRYTGVRS